MFSIQRLLSVQVSCYSFDNTLLYLLLEKGKYLIMCPGHYIYNCLGITRCSFRVHEIIILKSHRRKMTFFFFHEWKILTKFLHELIIRSIDHFTTKTYQSDVKHHKQSRSKHFTKLKSLTKLQCMKTILSTFCIHVQSRDNNWSFIKIR